MRILFALLLFVAPMSFAKTCEIIRVVDGDTIEVPLSCLPKNMKLFIRVHGIDTPEKGARAECLREANLAESATAHTKKLVVYANGQATLTNPKWDKYGGRMLANVDLNGVDLSKSLIDNGLARQYSGGKKVTWCEEQ